jgi:hypothetical protein
MRCRWVCVGLLVAAVGLGDPRGARADASGARVPPVVDEYATALKRLLRSRGQAPGHAPVESLYASGMRAADVLLDVLVGLDEATYAKVEQKMRGFLVGREEMVGARPDVDFFASLARSRGDDVDTAFFHALRLTYETAGPFPVYVEQQTDYSSCTDFGSGRLAEAFAVWQAFITRHPHRYALWADEELRGIEDELTSGTCACGDRESVLKELREFVERFPLAPVTPRVRERLGTIRSGTDGIRYHCIPP